MFSKDGVTDGISTFTSVFKTGNSKLKLMQDAGGHTTIKERTEYEHWSLANNTIYSISRLGIYRLQLVVDFSTYNNFARAMRAKVNIRCGFELIAYWFDVDFLPVTGDFLIIEEKVYQVVSRKWLKHNEIEINTIRVQAP